MKNLSDIFNECEKPVANFIDKIIDRAYKKGRADAIEEFVSKYRDWYKEPCTSDSEVDGEICHEICIDCFIKETGLLNKETKSEIFSENTNCDFKLIDINDSGFKYEEIFMENHDTKVRADEQKKIMEILDNADDNAQALYLLGQYLITEQLKEEG